MTPGKGHSNRRGHNWLIYRNIDRQLEANRDRLGGVLYDLGAGESPYRDYFLSLADQYVTVDWAGSMHQTNLDIEAD